MSKPIGVRTKKLLVAAVGVASVSYLACSSGMTSGNLVAPVGDASPDAGRDQGDAFTSSGNLMAPPEASAGGDVQAEAQQDAFIASGNLVAPLPEASPDAPSEGSPAAEASSDAPTDVQGDAQRDVFIGSGNLVAPLPDASGD